MYLLQREINKTKIVHTYTSQLSLSTGKFHTSLETLPRQSQWFDISYLDAFGLSCFPVLSFHLFKAAALVGSGSIDSRSAVLSLHPSEIPPPPLFPTTSLVISKNARNRRHGPGIKTLRSSFLNKNTSVYTFEGNPANKKWAHRRKLYDKLLLSAKSNFWACVLLSTPTRQNVHALHLLLETFMFLSLFICIFAIKKKRMRP